MEKKEEFDKLYRYVKKNVMKYDENQSLPPQFVLRLKGLSKGKFIENKKIPNSANYSYEIILATFKICKKKIDYAIRTKDFKSESQKFNYILAIVSNNLNDVYLRYLNKKKQSDKVDILKIDEQFDETMYKRKTKDIENDRLKNIW